MEAAANLDAWGWTLAIAGALCVGLGKGGLPGVGNITVALYAVIFPAKESVGLLLPLLLCGDVVAVAIYRRHADWRHLARLLPPAAAGVILGFFMFERMDNRQVRVAIGVILLLLTALHWARQWWRGNDAGHDPLPHTRWFAWLTGLVAGVTTMLANAAGPVAQIFLLAARLPREAFIGTAAWFFLAINSFKVPFQIAAGGIAPGTLGLSLFLGMFAALAAALTPRLVKFIPPAAFEKLVWVVIVLSAVKLIF